MSKELPAIPFNKFMIQAVYQWMVANDWEIFLTVNTLYRGVMVPAGYARKDGIIILDISPTATGNIDWGVDDIAVTLRFNKVPHLVRIPYHSVLAIYCPNNGQGTSFAPMEDQRSTKKENVSSSESSENPKPISHLRVIK